MIFVNTFLVKEGRSGTVDTFKEVITIGEGFVQKNLHGTVPKVSPEKQLFETCPYSESTYPVKPCYVVGDCLVSIREGTGFFDRNRTIQVGVASENQKEADKLIGQLFSYIDSKVYRHDVGSIKKTSLDIPEISFQNLFNEAPCFEKFIEFGKNAVAL